MPLAVAPLAVALLAAALLALAALWTCRFVRYRRAAQLSHARWLPFEGDASAARLLPGEGEAGAAVASTPDWPSLKPFMLSPIPEERFDYSGRDSESESVASARKDRRSTISVVPCTKFSICF